MKLLKPLSMFLAAEFFNVLLHALAREVTAFPLVVDASSWIVTATIAFAAGWVVAKRMIGARFLTLKTAALFWVVGIVAFPILLQLFEFAIGKISAESTGVVIRGYLVASVPFFFLVLGLTYLGAVASRRKSHS